MIPKGFLFSTAEAAIKKPGRKDLALIYSEVEAAIAGTFTTNRVKAAPVRLDMQRMRSATGQAVIVNSGNANACTGKQGMADAGEMTTLVARKLNIKPSLVFVCSTGVIGTPMPMDRIRLKMPELMANLGQHTLDDVARAIMTTDTFPKIVQRNVRIGGKTGVIAGICKGAGMIRPDMATMLCFLMTDIAVNRKTLQKSLLSSVGKSFNRVTIDGDMSTNDTALLMANGMLGNPEITEKSKAYGDFSETLDTVTYELSKMIAGDGEGASKLVEIEVRGARSEEAALRAAFSVADSILVKTALYGNDANWGRIMAALGYSGVPVREEKIDIRIGRVKIASRGMGTGRDREAGEALKNRNIQIGIDLNSGKKSAKVLTCDLTGEYIKINAEYRT
ncbi:MAG: bifunctional glutamate N-acetyltransferase/amino-acid acetyltransferase ArgJ [Nitrospirota bacterium]